MAMKGDYRTTVIKNKRIVVIQTSNISKRISVFSGTCVSSESFLHEIGDHHDDWDESLFMAHHHLHQAIDRFKGVRWNCYNEEGRIEGCNDTRKCVTFVGTSEECLLESRRVFTSAAYKHRIKKSKNVPGKSVLMITFVGFKIS